MEINKINGDILGVMAANSIYPGRMVVLLAHSFDNDFGSQTDLPGARHPQTADEGKRARHMAGWMVDNRTPPYYVSMPSYSFSMRSGGFGSTANVPFTSEVWLTWPGMQKSVTIPSGMAMLAYGAGTYTVWSGSYIYSAAVKTPGCLLSVAYTTTDCGKLQAQSTFDADVVVGKVVYYDTSTGALTVTTAEY
jgi:hypothetical protein